MTYKNLFLIVIIGILFVNLASALQIEDSLDKLYEKGSINPFGNKKLVYEPITEDKINSNNFMLSETSADYPIIRLSKSIFWIANDKIAEYKLTSVTSSIINAEATGKAILYQKGKLFDDVDFYDKLGNEKEIYYKYFILKNESYEEEIIDWKQDCSNKMTNGTAICESVKVGNHNETRYIFEWVEYELGTNLEVGNYEWKIEARRPANSVIDFIPIAQGIKLDEMAWWDNSWGFKRQINLTANVGNFSYMNLTYDSGMQSDLGDIRFVDCATESVEYNHTTENYTAEYFIERVHSLGANCLMMYYGNSGASSTSSSSNTHYQPLSYWFFDNDDFSDSIGANNGTNSGTTNLNGYIGDRRYFDGTGDDINVGSNTIDLNDGNFTILFKVNFQNVGTDNWGNLLSSDNSGAYTFGITDTGTLYFSKYGVDTIYSTAVINKNKNVTVGITYDTSANVMSWWINGTLRDTDSYGSAFTTGYTYLISSTTANRKFNGTIDEGAVFTKVLSASQMYEFHTYTTPTISVGDEQSLNQIMIYLNSPENAYNSTNATIDFNCSASDDVGLIWLNLSIDDSYVYNVTGDGTANLSLSYSTTLSQGNHNWTCSASDGTGINDPKTADARNLSIDSIIPTIFISAGNGTFDYGTLATNHTINYTITDTNLQSCWLNYNSTNTTIPCTSGILNTTNFTMQYNIYNGTLWANDTIGNYYGQAFSWNYNIFQGDIEYTTPIYEGQENTLTNSLFVSFPITSAYLVYENESYISQIISNATITTLINNIESEVNETKNNSFYWIIFYTGGNYSTITNYQEVIPIEINLCNSTYNTSFISAKLYDELNKTALTNGTIEYYFYINSYNTENLFRFYNTTSNNNFSICYSPSEIHESLYYVTGVIKYTSSSYAVETYNIQKDNLANYPKNISLYNLPSSSTTLFKMKYLGDNSIPKESYLLQIEREYVSEGNYSITEIPITSSVGTALANIDLTNNKYKIKVYDENNNLVKTYLDYTFMCDNALVSLCEVDLETIQKISPGQSFLQSEDTTLLTGINETTDVLTSEFETISGEPDTYTLIITKIEPNNITEIVNKELYTSKGSLSEDLSPYLDDQITTFNVIVEKGGRIIQNQPLEVDKLEGNFGRNNALLGLAILLFFFGIGVSSGLVLIVMTFVAVIVTGLTYLFNGLGIYSGIASLGSLIVVVIIIIVKISKRQN